MADKRRKFKVALLRYDEDGWVTVSKEVLNVVETLNYFLKMLSLHDDAEADGDSIESLMWEEDGVMYSLVAGDPDEPDI